MKITRKGETEGKGYEVTVSVKEAETLLNDYGTPYGTVYEVKIVAGSGHPSQNYLALQAARDIVGRSNDVWDQKRLRLIP